MWKPKATIPWLLAFAWALLLCGCTQADPSEGRFDVPAQSAASGLNEFARQADITLIFSYDGVAGIKTQPVVGRLAVADGLAHLLAGTGLDYRRLDDGTYLICRSAECGPAGTGWGPGVTGTSQPADSGKAESGNLFPWRLYDIPVLSRHDNNPPGRSEHNVQPIRTLSDQAHRTIRRLACCPDGRYGYR